MAFRSDIDKCFRILKKRTRRLETITSNLLDQRNFLNDEIRYLREIEAKVLDGDLPHGESDCNQNGGESNRNDDIVQPLPDADAVDGESNPELIVDFKDTDSFELRRCKTLLRESYPKSFDEFEMLQLASVWKLRSEIQRRQNDNGMCLNFRFIAFH